MKLFVTEALVYTENATNAYAIVVHHTPLFSFNGVESLLASLSSSESMLGR
jgi:hypothetical protein